VVIDSAFPRGSKALETSKEAEVDVRLGLERGKVIFRA
jgi:hypothetical protein